MEPSGVSVVPALRMPALVGRQREVELLRRAIEQGISGRGRVVVLAGEPGVGKTSLAEDLAAYALNRGVRVLWGRCHEGEGAPAFWPWTQIIRAYLEGVAPNALRRDLGDAASAIAQVAPEVGDRLSGLPPPVPLGSERARFLLFDGITRFVRNVALRRPLLLILDDLHWADQSSLALLAFVARHIGSSRAVVLGTYRDTEADPDHQLAQLLAELGRDPLFQRHFLSGLAEADVRQVIAGAILGQPDDRVVAAVYERTEGNPFFVGEIVRLLLADGRLSELTSGDAASIAIPPGVKDVIGQRLRRLSHVGGAILAAASVIGRTFSLNMLEPVTALDRSALLAGLDEALRAGLIERLSGSVGRFRFSHALIRETLYEELSLARRAALHQQVGAMLEHLHCGEIDPYLSDLAHHFFQAIPGGDTSAKAVAYAIKAGNRAISQLAYAEAVGQYKRALEALELGGPTDDDVPCDILLKLGEAHNHAGQYREAQETFQRAASAARERQRPEALARAALGAAGLGILGYTSPGQARLLEEGMTVLPRKDDPLRARVLACLAYSLIEPRTLERRRALVDEAEGIARRVGEPSTLLYVLLAGHWALWTPDNLDERLAITTEIIGLCEQTGETLLAPTAHAFRLYNLMELGDIPAVDGAIHAFSELARELGQPQRLWLATTFRAMRSFVAGDLTDAEQLTDRARAIGEKPVPVLAPERHFAQMMLLRREQGRLGELMRSAEAIDGRYSSDLFWQSLLTVLDSDLNREREARHRLDRLVAAIERERLQDPQVVVAAAMLSSTSLISRDPDTAERFYGLLHPYAGRNVVRPASIYCFGPVSHYLGLLAATLNHLDQAERHFEDAIAMSRRMGTRLFLAHSQYALSEMLAKRGESGDRDRARQLTSQALESTQQLGLCALEGRIRSLQLTHRLD